MTEEEQNGHEEEYLFDAQLIYDLDFTRCKAAYKPAISPINPGENLKLRSLCKSDYDKGFMELLKQLTVSGDVSREQFEARFDELKACKGSYYIIVIEDVTANLVIGAGTLMIEKKFIRSCNSKGRVEDVVVDDKYRGKQLGKLLLDILTLLCVKVGCYKISLECKDKMRPFYEQFGFVKEEGQNYMCQRF